MTLYVRTPRLAPRSDGRRNVHYAILYPNKTRCPPRQVTRACCHGSPRGIWSIVNLSARQNAKQSKERLPHCCLSNKVTLRRRWVFLYKKDSKEEHSRPSCPFSAVSRSHVDLTTRGKSHILYPAGRHAYQSYQGRESGHHLRTAHSIVLRTANLIVYIHRSSTVRSRMLRSQGGKRRSVVQRTEEIPFCVRSAGPCLLIT